jgi:hypothetical protein
MNINEAFPSKYLSAADLPDQGITVTIHSVSMELIAGDKDKEEQKAILYFVEEKLTGNKGMLLNRTNAKEITKQMGTPETEDWFNRRITIFPTQTTYMGEEVACIRVKLRGPAPAKLKGKIADSLKKSLVGKKRGGELHLQKA